MPPKKKVTSKTQKRFVRAKKLSAEEDKLIPETDTVFDLPESGDEIWVEVIPRKFARNPVVVRASRSTDSSASTVPDIRVPSEQRAPNPSRIPSTVPASRVPSQTRAPNPSRIPSTVPASRVPSHVSISIAPLSGVKRKRTKSPRGLRT
jgi:hypothetical protein